jgi:hypothetical protein
MSVVKDPIPARIQDGHLHCQVRPTRVDEALETVLNIWADQ